MTLTESISCNANPVAAMAKMKRPINNLPNGGSVIVAVDWGGSVYTDFQYGTPIAAADVLQARNYGLAVLVTLT